MAQDILTTIVTDFQRIYLDEKLKENSLCKELFQKGIKWSKLFSSNPQLKLAQDSVDNHDACVFFPNSITQQIFGICESLGVSEKILLTAQEGLGKTHALALYVYLKRQISHCRIFYIHDSQNLIDNPFVTFYSEIKKAFAEELSDPKVKQASEKLQEILKNAEKTDEERINVIKDFILELAPLLKKEGMKIYIIVDQVNVLAKERSKTKALIANKLLNSLDLFGNTCNIQVASKSYDEIVMQTQGRHERDLIPSFDIDNSLRNYIRFLSNDQTISDEIIEKIIKVTGNVPLEVRKFFEFKANRLDLHQCLQEYKEERIMWFKMVLSHFLRQSDENYLHMAFALESLVNERAYDSGMIKHKVDERYFYVDRLKKRVFSLYPMATEALKFILLNPFPIGEARTKHELQRVALTWLYSSNFVVLTTNENQRKLNNCRIIAPHIAIENFEEKFQSNIFDILKTKGYHTVRHKFSVIDGILVEDNKLSLIQIKRVATKFDLNKTLIFWKSVIDDFINTEKLKPIFESIKRNSDANSGVTREEIAHFFLSEALREGKSLDIIFITKNIFLDKFYYQSVAEKCKILSIRLLQLDIFEALEDIRFLHAA